MFNDISAYILAGGRNSRFGGNKALHIYEGEPLVQRIARSVEKSIPAINIIANEQDIYSFLNLPVYPDIVPGLGPLEASIQPFPMR
jgi:molybdopterin-guanine dinucleotide biosynthesis protein A